jgi:hypothetical protein
MVNPSGAQTMTDERNDLAQVFGLAIAVISALFGSAALISICIIVILNGNLAVVFGSNNNVQQSTIINNYVNQSAPQKRSSVPVEQSAPETEYVEEEETSEECTCPTEQEQEQVIEVDEGEVIEDPVPDN